MTNILDLLREKGLDPKKVTGGEWASPCPECGGRDRFRVWPEDRQGGSAWCRGCDWKGDNIQFCRDFLGLDFKDACDHVGRAQEMTVSTPRQVRAPSGPKAYEPVRPGLPPALWQQRAAELVDWAHKHLLANAEQLDYLARRGIGLEGVRRFRLGWCPGEKGQDIYRTRESWGLPEELKEDGKPKKLWVPRGIVIPVYAPQDGTENPVRIRVRRPKEHLREGDSKYIVLPGSTRHTLVTDPAARAFVIVEAELDAMLVSLSIGHLAGGVALGSLAHKPDAHTDVLLAQALAVLVALDYEPADAEADPKKAANLRRVYGWWSERYPRAERWPVPKGKDPGDAYHAGCDIAAWVTSGLPPVLRLGPAKTATDGPFLTGGRLRSAAALPVALRGAAAALARFMADNRIVLRKVPGGKGGMVMVPAATADTPPAAMDEVALLVPDAMLPWLDGLEAYEVTGEMMLGVENA